MTAQRPKDEEQRMHDAGDQDETAPEGTPAPPAPEEPRPFRPAWLVGAVAVLFGLFYAYDVWEAVDRWLQWARLYADVEQALPWGAYLAMVLAPFGVYLAAMIVGRRRSVGSLVVMLVVGLAVSAVLALSLQYLSESLYVALFS